MSWLMIGDRLTSRSCLPTACRSAQRARVHARPVFVAPGAQRQGPPVGADDGAAAAALAAGMTLDREAFALDLIHEIGSWRLGTRRWTLPWPAHPSYPLMPWRRSSTSGSAPEPPLTAQAVPYGKVSPMTAMRSDRGHTGQRLTISSEGNLCSHPGYQRTRRRFRANRQTVPRVGAKNNASRKKPVHTSTIAAPDATLT